LDFIKKLNIPNNAFTKEFQITEKNMDLYLWRKKKTAASDKRTLTVQQV
jgi:hypothetical protein